ncbi:HNH endonuclease [Moraxella osloensis]|uniref:HNH endonuclease n=1 Tax=Faucicola osloensis TaxID=34062 RepID=UPI0020058BCE|nr:HNH endonuclease [Moraxella osloensis]MCK6158041.1 HNH endonuclease [Moraxella osloensis]
MNKVTKQDNKRKNIPNKLRFEVFKRDSFTCQYCGQSAPNVVLEVDHLLPVSKGGDNDILNLITSCWTCNNGKSNILLTDNTMLEKQKAQLDELNEKRLQLEMMIEWRESLNNLDDDIAQKIADYFGGQANCDVNETGLKKIKQWTKKFTYQQILEAVELSVNQYVKKGTNDETNKAFDMVPRICAAKKRQTETGEDLSHLYYIRGILRNRVYCNDQVAIQLLKEANELCVSEDELKEIALTSKNWTEWRETMQELIHEIEVGRQSYLDSQGDTDEF